MKINGRKFDTSKANPNREFTHIIDAPWNKDETDQVSVVMEHILVSEQYKMNNADSSAIFDTMFDALKTKVKRINNLEDRDGHKIETIDDLLNTEQTPEIDDILRDCVQALRCKSVLDASEEKNSDSPTKPAR